MRAWFPRYTGARALEALSHRAAVSASDELLRLRRGGPDDPLARDAREFVNALRNIDR
jgi:hypothetical protein